MRLDPSRAVHVGAWLCALVLVVVTAIWTKENSALPALAGIEQSTEVQATTPVSYEPAATPLAAAPAVEETAEEQAGELQVDEHDISIRWFDGRPARPARVIYMTVTGYSPDARSCGQFADNKTAIMYSVWTNGMNLVAADPKVLPYWSLVSIPGYADDEIVPVLDCGGAIKGNRLDLLYPTHEIARQWGVRQVPVTVWEYIDEEEI